MNEWKQSKSKCNNVFYAILLIACFLCYVSASSGNVNIEQIGSNQVDKTNSSLLKTAAIVVVAPVNAPAHLKSQAELVCDGKNDENVLLESLMRANRSEVVYDTSPHDQATIECYSKHSVLWLPGDYYLDSSLEIPDSADCVINAQGTYFHYNQSTGDAVRIKGAYRCRYNFGTIESHSEGAAIKINPTKKIYTAHSFITFTGLVGREQKGTGLFLDASESNICVNKFEGTDIRGFDKGVFVSNAPLYGSDRSVPGKVDTNWYWIIYIRECNTCVHESGRGVDSGVWSVNVDATFPNSVALKIGGSLGRWFVHMGVWGGTATKAIILEHGAQYNFIELPLPLMNGNFYEDNSGNETNSFMVGGKTLDKLPGT